MKYLVSCLLAIPLLSSCTVVEEQYYDPGYYPPPPPRVEVHPIQPPRQFNNYHGHYQNNNGYRPAPGRRVYQGRPNNGAPVVVNPRPQVHGNVSPNVHGHPGTNAGNVHGHPGTGNVHGHPGTGNVHGHTNSNGTVHGHGGNAGGAVVVQPQASTAPAQPQPNAAGHAPQQSSADESQVTVHGHS